MEYLEENETERNYMLFYIGINVGLRISDILSLKNYNFNGEHINITEKKTKKERKIPILPKVRKRIDSYITKNKITGYMFQNKNNEKLSRHTAYRIMKKIQKRFSLEDLGTHTLRKTFGFHFYDRTNDIATLMIIFNHSSEAITLKYLGIQQDLIDKKMKKFGGF